MYSNVHTVPKKFRPMYKPDLFNVYTNTQKNLSKIRSLILSGRLNNGGMVSQ